MKITNSLSKSRGIENLLLRIKTVLGRFGITSKRLEWRLNRYSDITGKFGCVPTFPIPAVTLRRHPELIRKPSRKGIEFAVHGYIHTDYSSLSLEKQTRHFKKAIDTFKSCQIPFTGFRAPYLRINNETPEAIANVKFLYDSSHIIRWDVVDKAKYPRQGWSAYERLLDFYQPRSAQEYLVLPRFTNGFVEIPVSIPDDEAMVDRLGITDKGEITEIWRAILQRTYTRGELFTVQLHPERISFCESALADILQQARELNPPIWIATLGEIARWWKERAEFTIEVHFEGKGTYRVKTNCSAKATLLLKNCQVSKTVAEWSSGYRSISARDFLVESPARPVIGVGIDSSPEAVNFLKSEGFVVEVSDQPADYGIYLTDLANFQETDEKPLSEAIERSNAPLLRYWRWPEQARSALAITGDIDSITLIDFVLRIFETWQQNGR
jgi:peptidoglycan/xylan/chitin deacetylase (PgdA/CDA1 family)